MKIDLNYSELVAVMAHHAKFISNTCGPDTIVVSAAAIAALLPNLVKLCQKDGLLRPDTEV